MRNSFILVEEEKKRIRKLYEATSASASGAFEQPMAWSDEEVIFEPTCDGGDNIVDDSEEITIDFDEISELLGLSEEEREERIRKTQEENYIINKKDK